MPADRCMFCTADGHEATPDEYIRKITTCNNCRVDITLKGNWNGVGYPALQRIAARFPELRTQAVAKDGRRTARGSHPKARGAGKPKASR